MHGSKRLSVSSCISRWSWFAPHKKSYGESVSDSATVMTPECECPAAMKEALKSLFGKKLTSLGLRLS